MISHGRTHINIKRSRRLQVVRTVHAPMGAHFRFDSFIVIDCRCGPSLEKLPCSGKCKDRKKLSRLTTGGLAARREKFIAYQALEVTLRVDMDLAKIHMNPNALLNYRENRWTRPKNRAQHMLGARMDRLVRTPQPDLATWRAKIYASADENAP